MQTLEKIWNKNFTLHWLTNFLTTLGFYMLLPTLPVFAVKVLGASNSQVGYIIGFYSLTAVTIRPLAGYAFDNYGRKQVYIGALILFSIFVFSYNLATSLTFLLVLRFLHGFSWGVTTTGGGTIAADLLPSPRRGEGIGYFGLSMTIAMALGPMIGVWLLGSPLPFLATSTASGAGNIFSRVFLGSGNYGQLFLIAGLTAALAIVIAALVKYPLIPLSRKSLTLNAFVESRVLPICAVMLLSTLVYGGLVSFITLYSDELGIANGGLFFLIYAIAMSLTRPIAGKQFDRRGPKIANIIGYSFLIAGYLLLAGSREIYGFLGAGILLGIGNGYVWPTLQTMVINLVEPQRRGVANSTFFSGIDIGIGLGSIVMGWIANQASIGSTFLISAFILVLPAAYLLITVLKDYEKKLANVNHGE